MLDKLGTISFTIILGIMFVLAAPVMIFMTLVIGIEYFITQLVKLLK
jgi:hypothetical protein